MKNSEGDNRDDEGELAPPSFWTFLAHKTFLLDEDVERNMPQFQARIRKSAARGYGVGYEWITEPEKCTIEWPASLTQNHRSSRYFWYGHDHLFRGLDSASVSSIKGLSSPRSDNGEELNQSHNNNNNSSSSINTATIPGTIVEEDNHFERVEHIHEIHLQNEGDESVQGLLPRCQDMEGTYDIIFYGGEYKYFLRHHRTARGVLTMKAVPPLPTTTTADNSENQAANTDENDTIASPDNTAANNERRVLQGIVEMDPKMVQDIDIVPYGGNFTFIETDRYQRLVTRKPHLHRFSSSNNNNESPPIPTAAGVISVQVTDAPNDLLPMRYGGPITPNVFMGEMKVLDQDMAAGLLQDCPLPWGESKARDNVTRSSTPAASRSLADCHAMVQERKNNCLKWMRRHLIQMPPEVIVRIDEFVSPPPFFFLQKGDLVLSVDWSGGLPSYSAHSCLIARRRPDSNTAIIEHGTVPVA